MLDHIQVHSANNENEGERREAWGEDQEVERKKQRQQKWEGGEDEPAKSSGLGMGSEGNQTTDQGGQFRWLSLEKGVSEKLVKERKRGKRKTINLKQVEGGMERGRCSLQQGHGDLFSAASGGMSGLPFPRDSLTAPSFHLLPSWAAGDPLHPTPGLHPCSDPFRLGASIKILLIPILSVGKHGHLL